MSAISDPPTFRLLVGLGNPGAEYRETRHNVGFMVLDRLAAEARSEFRRERSWHAEVSRAGDLLLCKPQTFMNLSGQAVRAMCDFYKVTPRETMIVLDDLALPLGKLRFRSSGSAGGHNGMKSIMERLGTQEVPRLRIGIGAKPGPDAAVEHVLGRFDLEERPVLEQSLARAVEAIQTARSRGFSAAMNAFN